MTSELPLTVLTQTSTQDVETLQSELAQARERIAKLEEQKQTYENHLDDLIKTVAQRSQHIRDIERDLKKIQTIQALSTTDYTSSIDPEEFHSGSPDRYVYCAEPHAIITHKRGNSVRSELNATQPMASFLGRNLLLDTDEIGNPTYSQVGGPVSYGSEYYYKRASESQPNTPNADMPTARFNPTFSQTNILRKSQDSGDLFKSSENLPQHHSPSLREFQALENKLKRKNEKLKSLKKALEIKTQQLQVLELESSQNKLTLKLILRNYFPRIKSELEALRRQVKSEAQMAQRELEIQLNSLSLFNPLKKNQVHLRKMQELETENERAMSELKEGYEELLRKRDREHCKEMEAAVRAIRAEMELEKREAIKEAGCGDVMEMKMQLAAMEREKEDLETHIGLMLRAEDGDTRQEAIVSAETLRRKQLEKSYQELVRLKDERTAQFQRDIKEMQGREQKMRRSLENLITSLDSKENEQRVEKRVIHHNKAVLQAILDGRSFLNESLMISSQEQRAREKEEEKKPPPVREDELVYMERKSLKSESCMALPTEPMVVVTETESFEYVAPVFTENYSVKVQKKALVEDRAGREQEPKKKGGLLSNIFSRGEKKPKAHKIHRGEKNTSYFDKEKGRWVFPGQPEEQAKAVKPPPRAARDTRGAPRAKINKRGFYAPSFDDSQLHASSTDIVTEFKPHEGAKPKSFIKPPFEEDELMEVRSKRGPSTSEQQGIVPKPEDKEEIKSEEESEESVPQELEVEDDEQHQIDGEQEEESPKGQMQFQGQAKSSAREDGEMNDIDDISPVGDRSPPERRSHFTLQQGPQLRSEDLTESPVNSEERQEVREVQEYRGSGASGSPEMNMMANINFATTMNSSFYEQENPSLAHILEQRFEAEKEDIIEQFMKERQQLEFQKDDKIDDLKGEIETLREELEIHITVNAENELKIQKLMGDLTRNAEETERQKLKNKGLMSKIQELEEADAIRGVKSREEEEGEKSLSIKTEHISENQEAQKQILGLLEERNELLEEVAGLKEEIKVMSETNAEEIESLKNIQSVKISELETEAGDGAKEVENRLLRALDQEKKKHSKKVKELNGKVQELKKALNEQQQHDKQYLTRIHQQNDSIAKLEGEISEQAERFSEERESFVQKVQELKGEKEEQEREQEKARKEWKEASAELEGEISKKEEQIKELRGELLRSKDSVQIAKSESKQLKKRVVEVEKKAAEDVFILREDNTPLKQLYVSTEADLREEIKQKDKLRVENEALRSKLEMMEAREGRVKCTLQDQLDIQEGDLDQMLLKMISGVEGLRRKEMDSKNEERARKHEANMLEIQLIQSKKKLEFQNTKFELLKTGFYKLKQTYLTQEDRLKESERAVQEMRGGKFRREEELLHLREETEKQRKRIKETEEAYLEEKDKVERLEFEYSSLQRELESAKRISNAHRDEALSLEMGKQAYEQEKMDLLETIKKMEKEKEETIKQFEREHTRIQEEKEKRGEQSQQELEKMLQEKYSREQKEAEEIWKQEAAKAIEKLKGKIKEQKEKILKLQKQSNAKEVKELEAALEQKNKQLADIQRDKSAEINLLNARINALRGEKEGIERTKEHTQAGMQNQVEMMQKDLEQAVAALKRNQREMSSLQQECQRMKDRVEETQSQKNKAEMKLEIKSKEIEELNKVVSEQREKHHTLSQDYIQLSEQQKRLEEIKETGSNEAHELEQKEQEIAILQGELGRIQAEAKKYKALSEKSEAAKRIMELEDLIQNLKEENQIIKEQYREALSKDPEPIKQYALLEDPEGEGEEQDPEEKGGIISTFASFFLTKSDLKK